MGDGRLEWCTGSGERLVSGAVIPTVEEWGEEDGPPTALRSGSGAVGAACLRLQRELTMPLDLEFALVGDVMAWLQARPVTRVPSRASLGEEGGVPGRKSEAAARKSASHASAEGSGGQVFRGFAASGGSARAPAVVMHDPHQQGWTPGSVLVARTTDPDWLPLLVTASALATASGGMLCHTAIVAREMGLPAVTGLGDALLRRVDGRELTVDGDAGVVILEPPL